MAAAADRAAADNTGDNTNDSMGIEAVYTGLVPVVYKAQREMLNGLAWNFVTDLATIASVMTLSCSGTCPPD